MPPKLLFYSNFNVYLFICIYIFPYTYSISSKPTFAVVSLQYSSLLVF